MVIGTTQTQATKVQFGADSSNPAITVQGGLNLLTRVTPPAVARVDGALKTRNEANVGRNLPKIDRQTKIGSNLTAAGLDINVSFSSQLMNSKVRHRRALDKTIGKAIRTVPRAVEVDGKITVVRHSPGLLHLVGETDRPIATQDQGH